MAGVFAFLNSCRGPPLALGLAAPPLPESDGTLFGLPEAPSHPSVVACWLAGWRRPRLLLIPLAGGTARLWRHEVGKHHTQSFMSSRPDKKGDVAAGQSHAGGSESGTYELSALGEMLELIYSQKGGQ